MEKEFLTECNNLQALEVTENPYLQDRESQDKQQNQSDVLQLLRNDSLRNVHSKTHPQNSLNSSLITKTVNSSTIDRRSNNQNSSMVKSTRKSPSPKRKGQILQDLSTSSTANVAIKPDIGQVEADAVFIVNLLEAKCTVKVKKLS